MHWSSKYIGMPFIAGKFDCGVLAEVVLRDEFHKQVNIPRERDYIGAQGAPAKFRAMTSQITENKDELTIRTDKPQDGDGVLLISRGYNQHIGIYCQINGESWVLHANDNAKQVVLVRVRDLAIKGLRVEGYYRWK